MANPVKDPQGLSVAPTPERPILRAVPTPFARKLLAFEFVVLLEYWLAPAVLGVTNYAGIWSDLGSVLFWVLLTSLVVLVLLPLYPFLASVLTTRRRRVIFHGLWSASLVAGLFLTNLFQIVDDPTTGPVVFGQTLAYTPLGAWPTLTVYVPAVRLWMILNLEGVGTLFLLAWLSAASLVLALFVRPAQCPVPSPATGRPRGRLASFGAFVPLGFVSGCPGCSPAYIALLTLLAPGATLGTYASLPLVPWIGLAGLLFLVAYWWSVRLIGKSTATLVERSRSVENTPAGG